MKRSLQSRAPHAEQSQRDKHVLLRSNAAHAQQSKRHKDVPMCLAECGDTLSITELCAVLGISRREYFRQKAHRCVPVKPLPHLPHRFSKALVQRFLERGA